MEVLRVGIGVVVFLSAEPQAGLELKTGTGKEWAEQMIQ